MTKVDHIALGWIHDCRVFIGLAGLLWVVVSLLASSADPDLWGHAQYGLDVLCYGLPNLTTYSYSASDTPWVNHENLSELSFAIVDDLAGPMGLQLFRTSLSISLIALLWLRAKSARVGITAFAVTLLLVVVNIMFHWMLRPQLLSYIFCSLLLIVLSLTFVRHEGAVSILPRPTFLPNKRRESLGREKYWLLTIPIILAFWTNAHGGFLAGLGITIAYLGLRCSEWLLLRPLHYRHDIAFMALIALLTLAATLANPYGWRLHAWLIESLGTPRPEIVEWRGIDWARPKAWNYCLLMGGTLAVVAWSKRRVDLTHTVILILVAWQAIEHRRHLPFFVILFGFWVMPHIDGFLAQGAALRLALPRWLQRTVTACCLLAALYFGAELFNRLQFIAVPRFQYPVSALAFMKEHNLHQEGKIVVMYGWAQYVLGAFGSRDDEPGLKLACDGRFRTCYPQEVIDMLLDFELADQTERYRSPKSPPIDGSRILEFKSPDMVLLNRLQSHSAYVMRQNQHKWTLLYQDQIAELWGRSSIYDDPDNPRYVARIDRVSTDILDLGSTPWPAYP